MTSNFFNPSSVAIIGASVDTKKLGFVIVNNLKESKYKGRVYPINNKADDNTSILGYKVYQKMSDIHEVPELVIISIPSNFVFDELLKSYSVGCRNFVVITAGFKEIGNNEDEKLIDQFLNMHPDANMLGPNCLGFIDTETPINASFAASFPKAGKISFFSQSGALCTAVLDWSDKLGMGFSKFVSLGNKNQLSENTFLEERFLQNNPSFYYLESFKDGKEFVKKSREIKSPIVVLHPGRYSETSSAMQSHTGSIASDDKIVDEALNEAGIVRAYGLEDIMDLMMIYNFYSEYKDVKRVAIVSNAGGPGIITTDSIKDNGLELAKLSETTQKRLAEKLPRTANIHNPVDVVGDALADRYGFALDIVLSDPNVDAVIVLLTPQAMTQIDLTAEYIQRLAKTHGKVVVASFMGGKRVDRYEQYLFSYGIPYFDYPERAVWALSKLSKRNTALSEAITENSESLDIKTLFNIPKESVINNLEELKGFLSNSKIALKLISDQMWHKTESGGVILGLDTDVKREDAYKKLLSIAEEQKKEIADFNFTINAQEMLHIDFELLLGAKRDANFGNVVVLGIGGIYANIINENLLFLEFANKEYIIERLKKSKLGEILSGARGIKGIELEKLAYAVLKLHDFIKKNPQITDVDINPLAVINSELYAIDIKVK